MWLVDANANQNGGKNKTNNNVKSYNSADGNRLKVSDGYGMYVLVPGARELKATMC